MIWLIGNRGCLGSEVEKELKKNALEYTASDSEIDITEKASVKSILKKYSPDWIINCAAYTQVDKAEAEAEKAYAVNAYGVQNLATAAADIKAKIIHFSTDYVFKGEKEEFYGETDSPSPLSVYGKSKLLGENLLKKHLKTYYIVRTAWLYGAIGNNFVKKISTSLRSKKELKVINDSYGTPTYAKDLARASIKLIKNNPAYGTYHFSNEGQTSWYNFALEIRKYLLEQDEVSPNTIIKPVSSFDFKLAAKRPRRVILSKERIKKALGINIRGWEEALKEYLEESQV